MHQTPKNGNAAAKTDLYEPNLVAATFRKMVIDRFSIDKNGQLLDYQGYLALPSAERSNDEADAVDLRFARYTLAWLGFDEASWHYNEPQSDQKANRPDYRLLASIGTAFIWEIKNSTLELNSDHLLQMYRYCIGTAGYAVWCNMRRFFAVRFLAGDALKYEVLADVSIEKLLGAEPQKQATNLALFRLLFGRERFNQFSQLIATICVDESVFEQEAAPLDNSQAMQQFISGSRLALDHLRLAALAQIRDAIDHREQLVREEARLRREWQLVRDEFIGKINFSASGLDIISQRTLDEIEKLTPQVGEITLHDINKVKQTIEQVMGGNKMRASLRVHFETWLGRAIHINSALLAQRFKTTELFGVAEAYDVWSERQTDLEDMRPEVYAEQVAYVFFVRLLLVRVLEDKGILRPRFMSNGGFRDWCEYVKRHFRELDSIGVLNESYCDILARKASHYYMHFFQQAIFDWFNPEDFLFVETLEFLCRYNFHSIRSDLIGFTYEEYIDRNARNRKGHFLTRQDVVEYMLDLLDYTGPHILGRRILDPACGSGSFLVHAARRYRRALSTYFCNLHGLPDDESNISSRPDLHRELARRYLDDLTTYFFGMELNPFACYLAEMNLLIQGLDDFQALRQAGDSMPVDRFHIYNTDSLDLPREVLDSSGVTGAAKNVLVRDWLSDRIVDEAHPIKAKFDQYTEGFFYIISNPPYVSSKQESLDVNRFRHAEFYKAILAGDTNLYLLFLRLGMYFLAEYGQMIYIMPLTIFGDKSARSARKLLKTPPFSPAAVVRFYRGDILFPGVDQAVGIVRINHTLPTPSIMVSGGNTIQEARAAQFTTAVENVIDAAPYNHIWQGNWLLAQSQISLDIWQYVKQVSNNLATQLSMVLDDTFDRKQGDVNATIVNPLRLGARKGSFDNGDIAIYKGEDIRAYTSLPSVPSDWVRPLNASEQASATTDVVRTSQKLEQIKTFTDSERGIVLREVARLNTRERLLATWFERKAGKPIAFTHELWRMSLKEGATEEMGKALLALINSKTAAYLINLFSTNNHVGKDDLGRMPIPDPQMFPVAQLAALADELLRGRASLETDFVEKYGAKLPRFDSGAVYVPPSTVLAASRLPKLTIQSLVGRGEVKNLGAVNGRIRALHKRKLIVSTLLASHPSATAFAQVLNLFLEEPERENEIWSQAQNWQLPDTVAATAWLNTYNDICQQMQAGWSSFVALQQQADGMVADWYGFTAAMRESITEGLSWARRNQNTFSQQGDEA